MEITPREVIGSIVIVALMFILGLFIGDKVQNAEMEKQQTYATAVQINEDKDLFEYSMKTKVGNILAYGPLRAVDAVSLEEIDGQYFYIEKIKEVYTKHTRVVKVGKTTTVQTYHTWDKKGTEEFHGNTISFLGIEFPYGVIDRPGTYHLTTIKESSKVRYQYYVSPVEVTGTLYATTDSGTIANTSFYRDKDIQSVYESETKTYWIVLFWIMWILLTGALVFGFYMLDNYWLEG